MDGEQTRYLVKEQEFFFLSLSLLSCSTFWKVEALVLAIFFFFLKSLALCATKFGPYSFPESPCFLSCSHFSKFLALAPGGCCLDIENLVVYIYFFDQGSLRD